MKKIFLVLIAVTLLLPTYAGALQFGMAGAVKAQVKELDKKVREHGYLSNTPVSGKLSITSYKEGSGSPAPAKQAPSKLAPPDSFTITPTIHYGYANSGAPDYIKVTLKKVEIMAGDERKTVWNGTKELMIDGVSDIDTSDINLDLVEAKINKVVLYFDNNAKIKGTLHAKFNKSTTTYVEVDETLYTKAAYAYDSYTHLGGTDTYTAFETGPAEEAPISISLGGDEYTRVEVPVLSGNIDASHAKLTIAVDINRMLRFYNGLNTYSDSGVNPGDPANKAYFYCHSVFSFAVGAFIGDPGTIQGYQTTYASYPDGNNYGNPFPSGQQGWMTVIYDAGGNFLSGMLIGNIDNDLTICKGGITSYSDTDNSLVYSIDYGQNVFKVSNFVKQTVVGTTSPVATWQKTHCRSGDQSYHGEATFKLLFQH